MIQTFLPDSFDAGAEYDNMVAQIQVAFNGKNGVVLGISGGKDSSLVARLFADAVGVNKVVGVIMPNGEMRDKALADRVCEHFGIRHFSVDISPIYQKELELLSKVADVTPAASVNILPRIRMTTLYALAQTMGMLVAGTGNLSEATVGYCTKWGDTACDFNPLALYTCSEVIEIGRTVLPEWIFSNDPADGLWGKTDEENLGFTYSELDRLIRTGERGENYGKIKQRIEASGHKREPIPCVTPLYHS